MTGQVLEAGVGIVACLEALQPHWARALADAEAFNAASGDVRRGVGVASCWYGCGNTSMPTPRPSASASRADGSVVLHQGAVDIGQGSNTVIAQIAADALGVPLGDVRLVGADTAITPDAGKTSASRQTFVSGKAAEKAAQALREADPALRQCLATARRSPSRRALIVVREGEAVRRIDLVRAAGRRRRLCVRRREETYDPPTTPLDAKGQGKPYAVYG